MAEEREAEEGGEEVRNGGGNVTLIKTHLEAVTFESSTGMTIIKIFMGMSCDDHMIHRLQLCL